jgi:hypothetical protein
MEAVVAEIDALRVELGRAGAPDLLALVPPRRLAGALPSLAGLGSAPGARGRVATTPMPRTGPGLPAKPVGAISGGTQLLPPGASLATGTGTVGPTDTIAPPEGARARRGAASSTWREPPSSRGKLVVGLVLAGVVALVAGGFILMRSDGPGGRVAQSTAAGDENRQESRRAVVAPEEPPPAPAPPVDEKAVAAAPKPAPPPRDEPVRVVVRINSTPPGATVQEARTSKTLGVTPFEGAFARDRGEARLVLRKSGYRSKDVTVKLAGDADLSVTLDKRKASEPEDSGGDDRRKL